MALTADDLAGMYAFVPLPWDANGNLEEATLRHDVEYLANSGVTGLFALDSTGEFFTVEYEEFTRVVDLLVDVVGPTDAHLQVNCTWPNQRGALARAEYAADRGVDAVRFAFPFWEAVTVEEALRFVEALADATDPVPLVHYNIPRANLVFGADEYRQLIERVPQVIGTKLAMPDELSTMEVIEAVPELAHFVGEHHFASLMAAGASGSYSWLGTMNPRLAMEWFRACESDDWTHALEIQETIWRWRRMTYDEWDVHTDAGYNKLDARVNPNYEFDVRLRAPYRGGSAADVEAGRAWAREHVPELLEL